MLVDEGGSGSSSVCYRQLPESRTSEISTLRQLFRFFLRLLLLLLTSPSPCRLRESFPRSQHDWRHASLDRDRWRAMDNKDDRPARHTRGCDSILGRPTVQNPAPNSGEPMTPSSLSAGDQVIYTASWSTFLAATP